MNFWHGSKTREFSLTLFHHRDTEAQRFLIIFLCVSVPLWLISGLNFEKCQSNLNHAEFLLNFLIEQSKNRYESLENVTPEIDNILSAMDWCWRTNKLETLITFAERMDFYLWITGNWSAWGKFLEYGLRATVSLGAELTQAKFLGLLATMRDFQDDLDEAQDFIRKAINIYQLHNDKNELANSIWRLASIQIKCGKYEMAKKNLNKSLAMAEEVKNKRYIVRVQGRLAVIDIVERNYESAKTRLKQALESRKKDKQLSSGLAYTYRLLGEVSFLEQDYKLANQYFQLSLDIGQKMGASHNVAEAKQRLAELELTLGHKDEAKKLAQEAIEVFIKLGMKRQLRETQTLLDQITAKLR